MAAIWDRCVRPNINETTANQILKRCSDGMNQEDPIKASLLDAIQFVLVEIGDFPIRLTGLQRQDSLEVLMVDY